MTGQVEYAVSPSLAVYGQLAYADTRYDRGLLNGLPNRDSDAWRLIGGVNFDLSAFMRGTLGFGYVRRNYRSPIYDDVGGLSVEARVEYFPTQLTTVTLHARRLLDDSNIGGTGAYFDNQLALRVDHELRTNVLLNAGAAIARQDYIGSRIHSDIARLDTGARYLISRELQLQGNIGYAVRSDNQLVGLGTVRELSAEIGVVVQR